MSNTLSFPSETPFSSSCHNTAKTNQTYVSHIYCKRWLTQANPLKTILQDKEASKYASFGNNAEVLNGISHKYFFIMHIIHYHLLCRTLCFIVWKSSVPMSVLLYKSLFILPGFIPPLFFHLSNFLALRPPSSPFLFFRGETVDCQWPWSGALNESAVKSSSPQFPRDLCNIVPSRLAWASLLSLFTSRLSLLLSGHVFLLSARLQVSSLTLLPSVTVWLPMSLSFVGSEGCRSGGGAVFSSSGNSTDRKRLL